MPAGLTDLPLGECVCGRPLPATAVSDWACSEPCQSAWLHHALDPEVYPSPREIRAAADRAAERARRPAAGGETAGQRARREEATLRRWRETCTLPHPVDFQVRLFGGPMDGEVVSIWSESRNEEHWPSEILAHVPAPGTLWVNDCNPAILEPRETRVVTYHKVLLRVRPDHFSPVVRGAVYAYPGTAEVVWQGGVVDIAGYWDQVG